MSKPVIMHILSLKHNEISFSKPLLKGADNDDFSVGQTINTDKAYTIQKVSNTEKDVQLYVRETGALV